jgi:hypothetical protein
MDGFLNLCGEVVHKGTGAVSLNQLAELAVEELEAAGAGFGTMMSIVNVCAGRAFSRRAWTSSTEIRGFQ